MNDRLIQHGLRLVVDESQQQSQIAGRGLLARRIGLRIGRELQIEAGTRLEVAMKINARVLQRSLSLNRPTQMQQPVVVAHGEADAVHVADLARTVLGHRQALDNFGQTLHLATGLLSFPVMHATNVRRRDRDVAAESLKLFETVHLDQRHRHAALHEVVLAIGVGLGEVAMKMFLIGGEPGQRRAAFGDRERRNAPRLRAELVLQDRSREQAVRRPNFPLPVVGMHDEELAESALGRDFMTDHTELVGDITRRPRRQPEPRNSVVLGAVGPEFVAGRRVDRVLLGASRSLSHRLIRGSMQTEQFSVAQLIQRRDLERQLFIDGSSVRQIFFDLIHHRAGTAAHLGIQSSEPHLLVARLRFERDFVGIDLTVTVEVGPQERVVGQHFARVEPSLNRTGLQSVKGIGFTEGGGLPNSARDVVVEVDDSGRLRWLMRQRSRRQIGPLVGANRHAVGGQPIGHQPLDPRLTGHPIECEFHMVKIQPRLVVTV